MPSEPESGPTMMSTLSCSTSFRVALTATSGLASDDALMISIFLPATIPPRCFTASSAPRMPSWPPAANGPSSVASRPILTTCCCAVAIPARTTVSTAATTAVHWSRFLDDIIVSSSGSVRPDGRGGGTFSLLLHARPVRAGVVKRLVASSRPSAGTPRRPPEPRLEIAPTVRPPSEQTVGREQHDDQEHGADQQVEAFPPDQIDGEVLDQHEHDGSDERPDGMSHAAEHCDDQDVDQPARADRARRHQAVVPDHQ